MENRRVILIGFDAGILRSVNHFIDDLPNFARLIKEGVSCEARPAIQAGTPTNWTTIATGAYSCTHGIFGFNNDIGRIQGKSPAVELAETFGSKQNKAEYIWQAAERSGKKMILIHYPTAWPWTVKDSIAVGGCGVVAVVTALNAVTAVVDVAAAVVVFVLVVGVVVVVVVGGGVAAVVAAAAVVVDA